MTRRDWLGLLSSLGLASSASAQTAAQARCCSGAMRSHERRNARQASSGRSLAQPGRSDQAALTQREPRCSIVVVGAGLGAGVSMLTGGDNQPHDASSNAEVPTAARYARRMWLLLLEALGALLIFVFIVWWTMFSGRRGGERRDDDKPDQ